MPGAGDGAKPGPRLGIVYEPDSVDILALSRLVADRWPLVWLCDERTPASERTLLNRFGQVIETSRRTDELCRELNELGVSGLTTFADASLIRLAEIAEALGVVANSVATARCLVDKLAERDALSASGMPVPSYIRVDDTTRREELTGRLGDLSFPVVIKPAVGTGGRATVCVDEASAVWETLEDLGALVPMATFVIEECLGSFPPQAVDGVADYVSVEMVCHAGRIDLLSITGRMPLAPPFREGGHFIPANLPAETAAMTVSAARDALRAVGMHVGCAHVEVKLTPEGPRILEVNGRVGGGGIRDLLCALGASDPWLLAAELAMGEDVTVVPAPLEGPPHYTFALQPPLDRPAHLSPGWRQTLSDLPGVSDVRVQFEAHTASIEEGAYGYLALVSGMASDRAGLLHDHRACMRLIQTD